MAFIAPCEKQMEGDNGAFGFGTTTNVNSSRRVSLGMYLKRKATERYPGKSIKEWKSLKRNHAVDQSTSMLKKRIIQLRSGIS